MMMLYIAPRCESEDEEGNPISGNEEYKPTQGDLPKSQCLQHLHN